MRAPAIRRRLLPGLLLVVGILLSGRGPVVAGDGWWSGLDEGETVALADVIKSPNEYRDRTLTFVAVFHTASGEFKYYPPGTLFTEAHYLNFSAWPDATFMWESNEAWGSDLPFLYLPRSHAQRDELTSLEQFTRLEFTGRIRHVVRGRPAIEVFSFRKTGHRLGRVVLNNIKWGRAHMREGERAGYQVAARRFELALQPDLPPAYAQRVRALLADALRHLGKDEEAARYESGEAGASSRLPDSMPPEASQVGPDASAPAPGAEGLPRPPGITPDTPLPAGFGSPDGAASPAAPAGKSAPSGLPQGFGTPDGTSPPTTARTQQPASNGTGRKASAIPPRRRPRLNGVK